MNHLVIGIPTYKRPAMLAKLVRSIYTCERNDQLIKSIDLLIVDNDIKASAKKIAEELKLECPTDFGFEYRNFTEKGLSKVRNEILAKAIGMKPDYILFIDDDEYVSHHWLEQIVSTALINEADMVNGPVIPVLEIKVPKSISTWFAQDEFCEGQQMDFLWGTGNLLMKTQFLSEHQLAFDPRFNITGGEDSYFGVEALKKGAKIFWSKNAVVYETIPSDRANLKWLVKRKYRGATTYAYILVLEKDYFGLVKKFVVSGCYLIIGLLTLPAVIIPFRQRYWSVLKIAEGLGGLAGMFSLRYKEYF